MKKLLIVLIMSLLIGLEFGLTVTAESGVRYDTFTISNGRFVPTQTAYMALTNRTEVYGEPLDKPNDIYIDKDNFVYIVSTNTETSTGKIIKFSLKNENVTIMGQDFLKNPTGVYVDGEGFIYVADRGGNKAYKLDQAGVIVQEFTKPSSPLFGNDAFQPKKIVTDSSDNVYILNNGSRGLAQFTQDNEFLGYFGTNSIQPSLRTVLQFIFFTKEQRNNLYLLSPAEISNVAIDDRGLIHTVTLGEESTGVKRLNINGENLLGEVYNEPDLEDVYVGPIGNIYTVTKSGMITEYDIEGNLLFTFGGQDESNQIQGLFNVPSAIAVDDSYNLFILDGSSNELQIFTPTDFADMVHHALYLYQDGRYIESRDPWLEVLKMNDMFDLAHKGLGNAYYSLGEYDLAMEEYSKAMDRDGYSDAFWEVRNAYLIDNVWIILVFFFTFMVAYVINLKLHYFRYVFAPVKKGVMYLRDKSRILDECLYLFTYLKHPSDATYYIKRENRVGYLPATIVLLFYFAFYMIYIYTFGFLFNMRVIANINIVEEVTKIFLPFILFVFANYLIGSIREGEGRFKDIYVTTIFSLAPYFLTLPILTVLSQGLTYNETFLISLIQFISIFITVIYFFFMVKETHFYNVKETVASILISFFTMILILLGTFIVYILLNELFKLIVDLVMEVYYRV
ncbi:MAG: YIP1 family protein [Candidatus Izemoplasmatales bacterium]|jgi:tetratricopeptide (TPR) repeat protein|nr:YIP1 family protein [Candidatus Izemoplasmatales bacterium]